MRKDLVVARFLLTQKPIAPGAKELLSKIWHFKSGQPFSKTVTLTTNAVVPTKTLTIKGNVLAPESSKAKS
jgi:hypothetical protein